jgi:pimeloyl-ACP methyl ester carboxylesterase
VDPRSPGYAPSGTCERPKAFADDVADLQAVVTAAGGRIDVLGVSYGATVALHAAHADRSGIRSPVVFEPPLFAGGSALGDVPARHRALLEEEALAAAARLFAAVSRGCRRRCSTRWAAPCGQPVARGFSGSPVPPRGGGVGQALRPAHTASASGIAAISSRMRSAAVRNAGSPVTSATAARIVVTA